jgi:hypothetical protein
MMIFTIARVKLEKDTEGLYWIPFPEYLIKKEGLSEGDIVDVKIELCPVPHKIGGN